MKVKFALLLTIPNETIKIPEGMTAAAFLDQVAAGLQDSLADGDPSGAVAEVKVESVDFA